MVVEKHELDIGEIISRLGRRSTRNPRAQDLVDDFTSEARDKLLKVGQRLSIHAYEEVIKEVPGLRGAISLIKRITGNPGYRLKWEDGSELDIRLKDKMATHGLTEKWEATVNLYEQVSVQLDMTSDWTEAVKIVDEYRQAVRAIFADGPTSLTLK